MAANRSAFYKNMRNSLKVDIINYLNILTIDDLMEQVQAILLEADCENYTIVDNRKNI